MPEESVTICTVSFETGTLVRRNVALTRERNPGTDVTWTVVDNTPPDGPDHVVAEPGVDLRPAVPVPDVSYQAASYHHGAALNSVVGEVTTRHALVIDPDFFVVMPGWIERVRAHVEGTRLAFFGVPWHPRWSTKPRGFPAPHFLWIDGAEVDLAALDFLPQGERSPWERVSQVSPARRRFDRAMVHVLPDWMERRKVGKSRDTGSRIADRWAGSAGAECLVPHYEPERQGPAVDPSWRGRFAEQLLPRRLRLIAPAATWSGTGFAAAGLPDVDSRGWEEFLWDARPFGFHVRGYPRRAKGVAAGDTAEAVDAVLAEIREREPTVPPKESPDEGPL